MLRAPQVEAAVNTETAFEAADYGPPHLERETTGGVLIGLCDSLVTAPSGLAGRTAPLLEPHLVRTTLKLTKEILAFSPSLGCDFSLCFMCSELIY